MKRLPLFGCTAFLLHFVLQPPAPVLAAEPAPLLPESLAARAELASNQKTQTILIKEEDPDKALIALNASNEDFGKKGWNVFSILTYYDGGDFEGFFVTYQKSLVIE